LRNLSVDYHKAESLLHRVVGWLSAWCVQKAEVVFTVLAKSFGDVQGFTATGWPFRYLEHFGLRPVCQLFPTIRSHDVPLMPNAKEVFHRHQQPLAKTARSTIRQRSQELHVTNQMRPAELHAGSKVQAKLAVGAVVVATDHASKGLAKELLEDIRTPRVINMKPRETIRTWHVESPGPKMGNNAPLALPTTLTHWPVEKSN
jgi:hypothetical protein